MTARRGIPGSDIRVGSGTGIASQTDGRMVPLVTLTVEVEGEAVTAYVPPAKARSIGLDLIAAAAHAAADTAIRGLARDQGLDGDGLVLEFRARADIPPDEGL